MISLECGVGLNTTFSPTDLGNFIALKTVLIIFSSWTNKISDFFK